MRELWNEISYWLSSCKMKNALEKEYENTIVQCLGLLGWKKYIGEITTQYPIQVGRETKLADIVVSFNGVEQFVIEVKRPGHTIQPEDERQLVSYMRLAKHPVQLGLYIGDEIRLYYDDGNTFPEVIFCVDIINNNSEGERFVELFHRNTFDCIKLKDYCETILNNRIRDKALDTVLSTYCSEYGETALKELFGVTEETDAIVLVVSEETGAISLSYDSKLYYDLTMEQLTKTLEAQLEITPQTTTEEEVINDSISKA